MQSDIEASEEIGSQYRASEIELDTVEKREQTNPTLSKKEDSAFSKFELNRKRPTLEIILQDVGLTVHPKQGCKKLPPKRILQQVNARFAPGKMIAIMGSSGSGKTTLLNILGGRVGGERHGKILVNGKPMDKSFRRNSCYVMQEDLLLPFLTVTETLKYASKLRLPRNLTQEQRDGIVEQVITVLNLTECRDTFVGGEGKKGISGGQKKRVSIGQELLTDPSVILLDEPTSGLDSATSINLIRSLRDFSEQGRTVITTIHQPSAEIFFMFDKILFLANGNQVFFGSPKQVVPYFAEIGYECPSYQNPADYVLNLITAGYELIQEDKVVESAEITKQLIEAYPKHAQLHPPTDPSIELGIFKQEEGIETKPPSEFSRFVTLLDRSFRDRIRNPVATIAKVFSSIFFGVIVGLIFLQLGNNQVDIQNRNGVLFFAIVFSFMPTLTETQYVFPKEMALFYREKASKSYGAVAYYLSKIISLLPFQIFFPVFTSVILYFMAGLQYSAAKFFIFAFACAVVTHFAATVAILFSTAIPNFQVSLVLAPIYFISTMVLGGFFVSSNNIPKYLIWVEYISAFKYGYEIVALNEYDGLTLKCTDSELVGGVCPYTSGNTYTNSTFTDGASIWRGFVILLAISLAHHILALLMLKRRSKVIKA